MPAPRRRVSPRSIRRRAISITKPCPDSTPKSDSASLPSLAESFVGTERFLVQRRIGAGAFGVVYEAFDRQEKATVALKVLRFGEADALYRFKKGFRSLADLRHPNLVEFYELHHQNGYWFFSMEMIAALRLPRGLVARRRAAFLRPRPAQSACSSPAACTRCTKAGGCTATSSRPTCW